MLLDSLSGHHLNASLRASGDAQADLDVEHTTSNLAKYTCIGTQRHLLGLRCVEDGAFLTSDNWIETRTACEVVESDRAVRVLFATE